MRKLISHEQGPLILSQLRFFCVQRYEENEETVKITANVLMIEPVVF
jgi:hypothetical protein